MGCPPGDKPETGGLQLAFLGPWDTACLCLSFPTCSCGNWENAFGYGRCCGYEGALVIESTHTGLLGPQEEDSAGLSN